MTRPYAKRLQTLDADQLRRLATRQASTIGRLERMVGDAEKALARRHADLRDAVKDRDAVAGDLKQAREDIAGLGRDSALYERQGRHVKALYEAMLQRYVGVKLDTQQFTFPQAQQFLGNEVAAMEGALASIRAQVDDERNQLCAAQAEPERAAA
jgi:hypothetical protein